MKENYHMFLLLSISFEATFAQMRYSTFSWKNENHVSLEYVKKSKTDFDFFPDNKKDIRTEISIANKSILNIRLIGLNYINTVTILFKIGRIFL